MAILPYGQTSQIGGYNIPTFDYGNQGRVFGTSYGAPVPTPNYFGPQAMQTREETPRYSPQMGEAPTTAQGGGGFDPFSLIPGVDAVTSLAGSIFHGIESGRQLREAEKIRSENQRPMYEIPESQKRALQVSRMLSLQGLPGMPYIQEQIGQSTASGVRALGDYAQDPASLLAGVTGLYSQQQNAMGQVGVQNAQQRLQNLLNLQTMLQTQAQYEDTRWQYNEYEPYNQAMAAASALEGAGRLNKETAIREGVGAFGSLVNMGIGMGGVGGAQAASGPGGMGSIQGLFGAMGG